MATLQETLNKSEPVISTLQNAAVRMAARKLVERCYNRGVEIRITHGLRTFEQQNDLYAQGRTKPGKIVTNARGGESNHNYSLAIDFVLTKGGYDMTADNDGDGVADWAEVVAQAKLLGFVWGGDWKSFKDNPHFEMTFGLTIKQLQAGKRPTGAQIQAAIDKIYRLEDGENMDAKKIEELEAKVKTLTEALQGQAERGNLQDKRIHALEKKVNISGNQTPPEWIRKAMKAAKAAEVITTTNDKSASDFITIQMLYNMGMFDPGVQMLLNSARESFKKEE